MSGAIVPQSAARNPFLNLDDEKETSVRHKMKGKLCKLKVWPCPLPKHCPSIAVVIRSERSNLFEFLRGGRERKGRKLV
jgi:hypothetical protein